MLGISTAGTVTLSNGTNLGSTVAVGGLDVGTVTSDGNGGDDLVITFNTTNATPANVTTLLRALSYANTNTLNPSTTARSVAVTVNDGLAGVAAADILVNVVGVNDAPSGTDTTVTGKEDTDYIFTTADFGFSDDGNSLFAVKITTLPGAGVLTNNGSTVLAGDFVAVADITGGLLKYTPATDAHGDALTSFTFQVQDDSGDLGNSDLDPTPNTLTINVDSTQAMYFSAIGTAIRAPIFSSFTPARHRMPSRCAPMPMRASAALLAKAAVSTRSAATGTSLPIRQAMSARSSSSATPESHLAPRREQHRRRREFHLFRPQPVLPRDHVGWRRAGHA